MTTSHLYGVTYSPWTERARWALDHHGIHYRYHEHIPLLGEHLLRFRARGNGGTATVPLFVHRDVTIGDSIDIMVWTDDSGAGPPLIKDEAALRAWGDQVQIGLAAGRARTTARVLADPDALKESAMAVSPAVLASLFRPVAAQGARFIAKKYGANLQSIGEHEAAMEKVLVGIRRHVQQHGSAVDATAIVSATFLQFVSPVGERFIPLKPALRRAWTCDRLATSFEDVLAWRDRLFEEHRQPSGLRMSA